MQVLCAPFCKLTLFPNWLIVPCKLVETLTQTTLIVSTAPEEQANLAATSHLLFSTATAQHVGNNVVETIISATYKTHLDYFFCQFDVYIPLSHASFINS